MEINTTNPNASHIEFSKEGLLNLSVDVARNIDTKSFQRMFIAISGGIFIGFIWNYVAKIKEEKYYV